MGESFIEEVWYLEFGYSFGRGYPIKGSRWWCDILKSCELLENGLGWFQKNISRVIGDGREVSFWRAKWVSGETLCRSFNRVFLISEQKDSMIAEVGT